MEGWQYGRASWQLHTYIVYIVYSRDELACQTVMQTLECLGVAVVCEDTTARQWRVSIRLPLFLSPFMITTSCSCVLDFAIAWDFSRG